jgi:hypothetical protein
LLRLETHAREISKSIQTLAESIEVALLGRREHFVLQFAGQSAVDVPRHGGQIRKGVLLRDSVKALAQPRTEDDEPPIVWQGNATFQWRERFLGELTTFRDEPPVGEPVGSNRRTKSAVNALGQLFQRRLISTEKSIQARRQRQP